MTEVTQIRPGGNDHLADDVVGAALDGMQPEVYAAILDAAAARLADGQPAAKAHWWNRITGSGLTAAAFALLLVGVQCVVQAESWRGLTGFARLIRITGTAVQGVPVTLDGVSVISALLALRAELSDEPSGRERAALYLFTLSSVAANYWHGIHSGGIESALYFGGMSLAVTGVFDMLLRQIRRAVRRREGRRARPMPQFGLTQWIRYPLLTFRAWSLSIERGYATPHEALAAARDEALNLPGLAIDGDVLAAMDASHRLAVAFGAIGKADVPAALALLRSKNAAIDSSHAYKVRNAMLEGGQQ
jgi:hypothetical protein